MTDPAEKPIKSMDEYFDHARKDLAPMMASSAYVISINPGDRPEDIDPKIAIETGYMVLLNKPLVLLVHDNVPINPGLARIAHKIINVNGSMERMENQLKLAAALSEVNRDLGLEPA